VELHIRILGLVDKPDPEADAAEQDKAQKATGGLVIPSSNTALFPKMANEALGTGAQRIKPLADRVLDFVVALVGFIPRLVDLFMAGRMPLDRLITRYDFADIKPRCRRRQLGRCDKAGAGDAPVTAAPAFLNAPIRIGMVGSFGRKTGPGIGARRKAPVEAGRSDCNATATRGCNRG
jgi:hypothetical protein